jgi:NADPH2:quinone reductase
MKAIRLHEYGPAVNLRLEDLPDLTPREGEVRVAVAVAGVHVIDTELRANGAAGNLPAAPLPITPGREIAGTVDSLGPGVAEVWLGKRVVVHLGAVSGGYASQAVAKVAGLFQIPDSLGFDEAVAMVGTGRTTMAILELAAIRADDAVLVTAAAGGIGNLLVQEALAVGAFVVGAAGGPEKTSVVSNLGAHLAMDYLAQDWPGAVREALGKRRITVVLDGVGGDLGTAAMNLLGPGGRLVLFGFSSGKPTRFDAYDLIRLGITASAAIGARMFGRDLRPLQLRALQAAATGRWKPLIGTRFPLADAAAAHTAIVERRTIGKTVLLATR